MDHLETAIQEVQRHLLDSKPYQRPPVVEGERKPVEGYQAHVVAGKILKLKQAKVTRK